MPREALELRTQLTAREVRARILSESLRPWRFALREEGVVCLSLFGWLVVWRSAPGLLLRLLPRPALWCRFAPRDGATVVSASWGLPPDPLLVVQLLLCVAVFVALFGLYGLLGSLVVLMAMQLLTLVATNQLLDEDGDRLERWLMRRVSPFAS